MTRRSVVTFAIVAIMAGVAYPTQAAIELGGMYSDSVGEGWSYFQLPDEWGGGYGGEQIGFPGFYGYNYGTTDPYSPGFNHEYSSQGWLGQWALGPTAEMTANSKTFASLMTEYIEDPFNPSHFYPVSVPTSFGLEASVEFSASNESWSSASSISSYVRTQNVIEFSVNSQMVADLFVEIIADSNSYNQQSASATLYNASNGTQYDYLLSGTYASSITLDPGNYVMYADTSGGGSFEFPAANTGTGYVDARATISLSNIQEASVLNAAPAVPEPASLIVWSLLGLTVGSATWWRRRKPA